MKVTVTIPPELALVEQEAAASGRTVEQHIQHVLAVRYRTLRRICVCGYFVYVAGDDRTCHYCGVKCCPFDSIPVDYREMCFRCAAERGLPLVAGFGAAPEEKI